VPILRSTPIHILHNYRCPNYCGIQFRHVHLRLCPFQRSMLRHRHGHVYDTIRPHGSSSTGIYLLNLECLPHIEYIVQSLKTHVFFFASILRSTPIHIPLKYTCLYYHGIEFKHVYLRLCPFQHSMHGHGHVDDTMGWPMAWDLRSYWIPGGYLANLARLLTIYWVGSPISLKHMSFCVNP
jgi:hypothetical protein